MSEMRLMGVDVTDIMKWVPSWEWFPDASHSAYHPDRLPFILASAARLSYLPLQAPAAPPMECRLFPEHRVEVTGAPVIGQLAQSQVTRNTADEFYRLQAVRAPDIASFPRVGCRPPPGDPEKAA
eukprot:7179189-Pyramimonas_sp.AAC.1